MSESSSPQITTLLERARNGDPGAEARLAEALAPQLQRLARAQLRNNPDSLLESAALINEAWIRLCGEGVREFEGRLHFLRAASRTMRSVLVDRARSRSAIKRGGGAAKRALDEDDGALDASTGARDDGNVEDLLALDDALGQLEPADRELAELRLFAGLTCAEISTLGGGARRSLQRRWSAIAARLKRELGR